MNLAFFFSPSSRIFTVIFKVVYELIIADPEKVHTAQKMKFSITDFFSKCDQIRSLLRIWSHLPKKYLMENFILCAVFLNNQSFIFQEKLI